MNILFLASYFPSPSSPSRGNWALKQALAFRDAGHEVRVVVPTPWLPAWVGHFGARFRRQTEIPKMWEVAGLRIDYPRWPSYPWHFFNRLNRCAPRLMHDLTVRFLLPGLMRTIREMSADAVVAHHTLVCGQVALRLKRDCGLPFVVTDHEIGDLIECGTSHPVRRIFEDVGQGAKAMVAVSEAMKRCAREVLPETPFQVIYNGTSASRPSAHEQTRRTNADGVIIFCCAKFYGRKDIPLLVSAFDELAKVHPGVRLRIARDGPDRALIESKVMALECRERVSMLGLLTPKQVREEMLAADIFALVGWAEPFGVVFLEAMAAGLPVVVSEDAGVAEVLTHSKTACFTQPRDESSVVNALDRLVRDPAFRNRIGQAGQALFERNFRWSEIIRNYEKILAT
jgi:glycosyltransferase involved in cell wall biosynthesis